MDIDKKSDELANEDVNQQPSIDSQSTNSQEQVPLIEAVETDENTFQPDQSNDAAVEPALPGTVDQVNEIPVQTAIAAEPTQPPRKHNKWLLIGIAITVALALMVAAFVLLRQAKPKETVKKTETKQQVASQGAAITFTEGTVEYTKAGKWQPVTNSPSLTAGDSVRTGNASRTIIALDDGSAIRLDQNSEVTLTRLTTKSVVVTNKSGNVYTRVTPSTSRTFVVAVNGQTYTALGTAFKTTNDGSTEGVAVYQSKVETSDKTTVEEGKSYYVKTTDTTRINKVSDIDVVALKADAFLKWNKTEDEKEPAFADKLGTLKDIDVPVPAPAAPIPVTIPTAATPAVGIVASGAKTDAGIKITWTPTGIDTKNGFKVAYSKSSTSPTYGADSAKFVDGSARSVTLEIKDGKTWHVRVCRYDGDGKCSFYSNTVSVTAPYVEPAKVTSGTIDATLSGSTLNWTFTGSAPYGYKVVWSTSGSPTYPPSGTNGGAKLVSGNSLNIGEAIPNSGTYKVRVCVYTNGTDQAACLYYSTEIDFTKQP